MLQGYAKRRVRREKGKMLKRITWIAVLEDENARSTELHPDILKSLKIKIYKTIILPVVLYICKTLREECRVKVFKTGS